MSLAEAEDVDDTVVEAAGIKFVLDPLAYKYANGALVDYRSSFFGRGFTIRAGSC
ncbi:MAG TPA: hypothetical protein GX528_09185 [Firmicutes bacterium]|nr:hypothetical protein [Bacillota bacterium]